MAIYKNTPPIVTNGLVLCVDAANPQSYLSGSTVWGDLSGNGYIGYMTGSFTSSPTSLIFNGTNSYITSSITQSNNFTYNIWFNRQQSGREQHLVEFQNTQFYAGGNNKLSTSAWIPLPFSGSTTLQNNQWYNATLTRNSGSGIVSIYLNGILENTTSSIGTDPSGNKLWIGQYYNGGAFVFSGSIGPVQVYNRALSPQEITQNYNALKSRFNLT